MGCIGKDDIRQEAEKILCWRDRQTRERIRTTLSNGTTCAPIENFPIGRKKKKMNMTCPFYKLESVMVVKLVDYSNL